MKTRLLAAVALCAVPFGAAIAQEPLFRNTNWQTFYYGPSGVTGYWNGQSSNSTWTRWPERGAEIIPVPDKPITQISVKVLVLGAQSGGEHCTLRIYATDGPSMYSHAGNGPYRSPGTVLFQDVTPMTKSGDQFLTFQVPHVIPRTSSVVVTLHFTGGNYNVGPFDPAINPSHAGFRFGGWPEVGGVPDVKIVNQPQATKGRVWRRVFTPQPSQWGCDESFAFTSRSVKPRQLTGFPYVLSCSLWYGEPNGWDNSRPSKTEPWDFRRYPQILPYVSDGQIAREATYVSLEGTQRVLTGFEGTYTADTRFHPGAKLQISLARVVRNKSRVTVGEEFWTSGWVDVPDGVDPRVDGTISLKVPLPDVEVPTDFFVIQSFTFPKKDIPGYCGPVYRLYSDGIERIGRWGPLQGFGSMYAFWQNEPKKDAWTGRYYKGGTVGKYDCSLPHNVEVNGWAAFMLKTRA